MSDPLRGLDPRTLVDGLPQLIGLLLNLWPDGLPVQMPDGTMGRLTRGEAVDPLLFRVTVDPELTRVFRSGLNRTPGGESPDSVPQAEPRTPPGAPFPPPTIPLAQR